MPKGSANFPHYPYIANTMQGGPNDKKIVLKRIEACQTVNRFTRQIKL